MKLQDARFIDVHYHANPDAFVRRHGALEAGRQYAAHDGWVVLKNHLGCCAAQAWEARQEGLPVSGSVVLNEIAGGVDFRVVQRSLCLHGDSPARLIVHLPTVTGRKHNSSLKREIGHSLLQHSPILPTTVSCDGRLTKATQDILRMAKDYPIVISTGHANAEEIALLVDAAVCFEVPRLMLNQPANPLTGLNARALRNLAEVPAVYAEQTALTYLLGYQPWEDFEAVLKTVPRTLYSSDLGQTSQMDVKSWLGKTEEWFGTMQLGEPLKRSVTLEQALQMLQP